MRKRLVGSAVELLQAIIIVGITWSVVYLVPLLAEYASEK